MTHTIPKEIQPAATARLLDALPGLVGAIDTAIQEHVGEIAVQRTKNECDAG